MSKVKPVVKVASIMIGILSVSAVVGYVYLDVQDLSPGLLSAVHAQVPELAGADNCEKCHGANNVSMSESCMSCHAEIANQITSTKGIHGKLTSDVANKCWQCHSEHQGHDFRITNRHSFEQAGVGNVDQFNHSVVPFHLDGAHLDIACNQCHQAAAEKLLPVGTKRFLGLTQDCQSCHEDVHQGTYGSDCASCHGQAHPFSRVAEFKHTDVFGLRGSHENLDCKLCHRAESEYSVAALLDPKKTAGFTPSVRKCSSCHESPHRLGFTKLVAQKLALFVDDTCQVCHADVHTSFNHPDASITRELHALTGFPLEHPHHEADCQSCHREFTSPDDRNNAFASRFPGRHMNDCRVCHGDPHLGQFDTGSQAGKRCLDCHERHSFSPAQFSAADHETTAFPVHGAHANLACFSCHKEQSVATGDSVLQVRRFKGTTTSCVQCHHDPHFGQFQHGVFRGEDCSTCHDDRSFVHPTFTQQQHELTGFSLSGGHAAVGCNQCHTELSANQLAQLKQMGSEELVARQFHATPTKCNACHADVHRGAFDKKELPAVIGTLTDCARCHTTASFRAIRNNQFDHKKWTGFDLGGAHADTRCTDCHRRAKRPDQLGRSFGIAAGRNCQDCHSDPHVAQFGATTEVNCLKCHSREHGWTKLTFDHQRDSAFSLDEQHVNLACASCHKSYPLTNGKTAVRYKPLGTTCADCHLPRSRSFQGDRK